MEDVLFEIMYMHANQMTNLACSLNDIKPNARENDELELYPLTFSLIIYGSKYVLKWESPNKRIAIVISLLHGRVQHESLAYSLDYSPAAPGQEK